MSPEDQDGTSGSGWSAVPPPPARRRRWLVPLAALLAVLLAGALATARLRDSGDDDGGVAVAPTPSATPTATPTAGSPRTPPKVDDLAQEVAELRGLPVPEALDTRLVGEDILADKLSQLLAEELDEAELERARRMAVALRLLPADLDLRGTLEALYREQVIGLYVPKETTLYVRTSGESLTPFEQATTVHEIVHALQDGRFDLEAMQELDPVEADEALAVAALTEGDAIATQQLWASRFQTEQERDEATRQSFSGGSDVFDQAPPYLQASLVFPYVHGARFVEELLSRGGFEAVDEALAAPPTTTAEILHPERYLEGREGQSVPLPADPGADWTDSQEYTFGEFDVVQLFTPLDEAIAADLGHGWAGGRVASWTRGADTAVAVSLAFDTPEDADAVCRELPRWFETMAQGAPAGEGLLRADSDWMAFSCPLPQVRFSVAPEEATARALASGAPAAQPTS